VLLVLTARRALHIRAGVTQTGRRQRCRPPHLEHVAVAEHRDADSRDEARDGIPRCRGVVQLLRGACVQRHRRRSLRLGDPAGL
jgi:hypothetical protein